MIGVTAGDGLVGVTTGVGTTAGDSLVGEISGLVGDLLSDDTVCFLRLREGPGSSVSDGCGWDVV